MPRTMTAPHARECERQRLRTRELLGVHDGNGEDDDRHGLMQSASASGA